MKKNRTAVIIAAFAVFIAIGFISVMSVKVGGREGYFVTSGGDKACAHPFRGKTPGAAGGRDRKRGKGDGCVPKLYGSRLGWGRNPDYP